MKGVSPIIAVVLLIAFTVTVGGILSVWLTGYTRSTTETVESRTEKTVKCSQSYLKIKEAKYYSNNITILVYYESGRENLENLTMEAISGVIKNTSQIYLNTSGEYISPGDSFVGSIDTTGGVTTPEYVRVKAICLDEIAVLAECESGETCMVAGS
jgi:flagellin-like protein